MPTRVLLLRHAETTHPHVFNGFESDVGLSARGERQAQALAPLLAARAPAVVVSSGMRRALHTAQPIAAACALPLRVEPELHERKVGGLVGLSDASSGGVWTETLRRWQAGEADYAPSGSESFAAMQRRLLPVWQRLTEEYAGQTLVIVAHGMVKRVLLLSLLPGWGLKDWPRVGHTPNAGICELLHEGEAWQAVRLNHVEEAVAHLDREPA